MTQKEGQKPDEGPVFYMLPPGKKFGEAVKLSNVKVIKKANVITAQGLPEAMEFTGDFELKDASHIGMSVKPRLLVLDGKGCRVSFLKPVEGQETILDTHSSPNLAESKTLKTLAEMFNPESRFMGELDGLGIKPPYPGKTLFWISHTMNGIWWQQTDERLAQMDGRDVMFLWNALSACQDIQKGTLGAGHEVEAQARSLDPGTVKRIMGVLSGRHNQIVEEGSLHEKEVKAELEVGRLLLRMSSPDEPARLSASNDLLHHFGQLSKVVEPQKEEAIVKCIRCLEDPNSTVRANAAHILGFLKSKSAIQPFMTLLEREDSAQVKVAVAVSAAMIGDRRLVPALNKGLSDDDPEFREGAAYALWVIKDPRSIGPLKERVKVEGDETAKDMMERALEAILSREGGPR